MIEEYLERSNLEKPCEVRNKKVAQTINYPAASGRGIKMVFHFTYRPKGRGIYPKEIKDMACAFEEICELLYNQIQHYQPTNLLADAEKNAREQMRHMTRQVQ